MILVNKSIFPGNKPITAFPQDISLKGLGRSSHVNALSRIPETLSECACFEAGISLENLPCGGCHYCTRDHKQWSRFQLDVDDVIPLSIKSNLLGLL